jgi:hypothetical protein
MVVALADVIAPSDHEFRVVARWRDLGQRGTSKACSLMTNEKRRSINVIVEARCKMERLTWLVLALVR